MHVGFGCHEHAVKHVHSIWRLRSTVAGPVPVSTEPQHQEDIIKEQPVSASDRLRYSSCHFDATVPLGTEAP